MTISYNWLCTYLPIGSAIREEWVSPEKLGKIMTSIGLEVESLEHFESIRGGLAGLVTGEVVECVKHPNADKLSLTKVNIGGAETLQVVCGAPNVARGQKVIVAPVGTTLYPANGEPLTMKNVKIRGEESQGMICAADEIGVGDSHEGIMVLPEDTKPGTPVSSLFPVQSDWIYEIGLTPNRMDAMSHLGVARDVCAWFSNNYNDDIRTVSPFANKNHKHADACPIGVEIVDTDACQRYAGAYLGGVQVQESPDWLKNRLISIGLRPINNIVDITNFILHETGQPLHAFDADKIAGQKVIVQKLPPGTPFLSLDGKERKLDAADLIICDGNNNPMCIGGVYGGIDSGVTNRTTNIFLESAWFEPVGIRRTAFRHNLRTDAAARFEKGVDISQTVQVLHRAVKLILETGGGEQAGAVVDVYPQPAERPQIPLKFQFLKKLSGRTYHVDKVKRILQSLGFEIIKEGLDDLWVSPPYSKPDVEFQADVVEEIMRIDGYDNVEIPAAVSMVPGEDPHGLRDRLQEKVSAALVSHGFYEIMTNSITNCAYYPQEVLDNSIEMLNNLSADLNMLRPSMLETGLEVVAFNLNRRNSNLRLFEFGKTFKKNGAGDYTEEKKLAIFITGNSHSGHWNSKPQQADIFYLKGLVSGIFDAAGSSARFVAAEGNSAEGLEIQVNGAGIGCLGKVEASKLERFGIRQPVWYASLAWEKVEELAAAQKVTYRELVKFPRVERDLSVTVDKNLAYADVEKLLADLHINRLIGTELFDVFESEKIGKDKKSWSIHFIFEDREKTLTDNEVEEMMAKIMKKLELGVQASIRN